MRGGQERNASLRDVEGTALLLVDLQRLSCDPASSNYLASNRWPGGNKAANAYLERLNEAVFPAVRRVIDACRSEGVEVIYTVIEALTLDGRERCFDHKVTGFLVPKGHEDAQVMPQIQPQGDEMVLPKSASGVFSSTPLDYVLRNLGVHTLIVAGVLTNQCIESAVREAADRGYNVVLMEDGCAGTTAAAHEESMANLRGYSRIVSSQALVHEICGLKHQV